MPDTKVNQPRKGTEVLLLCIVASSTGLALLSACRSAPQPSAPGPSPQVLLREAPLLELPGGNRTTPLEPGETDSNSPMHWEGDTLYAFHSAGHPWRSAGPDVGHLDRSYLRCEYNNQTNGGRWIECTWKADNGMLYGWYHFEPTQLCPGTSLTAPRIGAVRSGDNGAHWEDLGVVLEAPPGTLNCASKNFYFAGGNGDFSIMVDRHQRFLYFFFSTYAGEVSAQGVAVARMAYRDRDQPVGRVWKFRHGGWIEPGVGGQVTPVFPAIKDWHRMDADAFWGPSIHWNTHLCRYVMLLNRAIDKDWTQEGIYVSYTQDLADPRSWSPPVKIMGALVRDQWYPQVVGIGDTLRGTDKLAGRTARLFVRGKSRWHIAFLRPEERE